MKKFFPLDNIQTYDFEKAVEAYGQFLTALGFSWQEDPHMKDTPRRVVKAWINDLAKGHFNEPPEVSRFDNTEDYNGMVIQKDIAITSLCAHHNLPFFGKCVIAYLPQKQGKVIGLSKLNRIAHHFAKKCTVQETLTKEIHDFVNKQVDNRGVAVVIESQHCCVSCRGVRDNSNMVTSQLSGYFFDNTVGTRTEFFSLIK